MASKRTTIELLVLMLTGTVCAVLLVIAGGIAIIEVVNPQTDTSSGVTAIATVVSTLLGGVLGLIAGHSTRDRTRAKKERAEGGPEDEYQYEDGGTL